MTKPAEDGETGKTSSAAPEPQPALTWWQAWSTKQRVPTRIALALLLILVLGLGGGFLLGRRFPAPTAAERAKASLPESFKLPVSYGDIGPALLAAGAINQEALPSSMLTRTGPLLRTRSRF